MATDKYKALVKEYRKLAKRADQRLVRLEKYATEKPGLGNILQYAYRRAKRDIRSWSGDTERPRFNTKPPSNTNTLKAKIADIKNFLNAQTSMIGSAEKGTGILGTYQKRVDTINERYGTNFTWESLAKFYDSGISKKLDEKIKDSQTLMRSIGQIQDHEDEIKEAINNNEEVHIDVDDPVVEFEVNKILEDYGIKDISQLFG